MIELLLATHSAGKIREIRAISAGEGWIWRGLDEFPAIPEAVEDGATFRDNAGIKALYYSRVTGLPALADDSGLEVDALGGAPGVHSAYYAGQPRDDAANNARLVLELCGVEAARRQARFRCVMAFAFDGQVRFESQGAVEGVIIDTPRGEGGFGYDPYFLIPSLGVTSAELPAVEKNRISHRGQALRAILPQIRAWIASKT